MPNNATNLISEKDNWDGSLASPERALSDQGLIGHLLIEGELAQGSRLRVQ